MVVSTDSVVFKSSELYRRANKLVKKLVQENCSCVRGFTVTVCSNYLFIHFQFTYSCWYLQNTPLYLVTLTIMWSTCI